MLNMGILGMGKMGEFHAGWINANKDMKLVAICEKNKKRIAELKQKYDVPVYKDVSEFLKVKDIDYVVIVTTHESHEELAVLVLENKKNVIVEKPMAMNYESALRMIKAAEKNDKNLFVHHSSRWDRDFLLIKQTIKEGTLGDILLIRTSVMLCDEGWPAWGIEGMANPWRIKKEYGGGMLLDWGPHLVDQLLLLVGDDPIGVYGVLQSGVWSKEVDDYFFADIKFKSNIICQIEASNNARMDVPRWYVIGTRGTLVVPGRSVPTWEDVELTYVRDDGRSEYQKVKLIGARESGIEGGFYKDLVPYLNGEIKEFVSMYEASKVVKILNMIRKSSEEKRFVEY
jgi:predicted dehydrogenase